MIKTMLCLTMLIGMNSISWSQTPPPPPPMIMATKENQILIDEIIELTKFKEHYTKTCTYFIELTAKEQGWDFQEVEERKQRMDVNRFIEMNFYSFMAVYSSDELKEIISCLKMINKKQYYPFFLNNPLIENNLLAHISYLVE